MTLTPEQCRALQANLDTIEASLTSLAGHMLQAHVLLDDLRAYVGDPLLRARIDNFLKEIGA